MNIHDTCNAIKGCIPDDKLKLIRGHRMQANEQMKKRWETFSIDKIWDQMYCLFHSLKWTIHVGLLNILQNNLNKGKYVGKNRIIAY